MLEQVKTGEDQQMVDIPIIDTHLHLWDTNRLSYPWLANLPKIDRPRLPEGYRRATAGLNIEKMVFMQCEVGDAQYEQEVAWVTEQAGREPRIKGIVAWAPLEKGEAARAALGALREKYPLMRGIRRMIQLEDNVHSCLQPDFVKGVQLLADFDLHFEIGIKSDEQFRDFLKLVRQCPDVPFMLNHIGKPPIKENIMEPWAASLKILAGMPNTWCKVSGLVTETDMESWTSDDIRPYLDHVLESFGFDRVVFGSDWPVVTLASSYRRWIETLWEAVSGYTNEERKKLFNDNAAAFYRV